MRQSGLIQRIAAVSLFLTTATACTSLETETTGATVSTPKTHSVTSGIYAPVNRTSQPIGAYDFCREAPANCPSVSALNARFKTSAGKVDEIALLTVNAEVNRSFTAMLDKDIYGVEEKWAYPDAAADCEDYALEKRKRLLEMGMPAQNMAIAVVQQQSGDGHAILLAKVGGKIYQLDNLDDGIHSYENNDHGYKYLKWSSDIQTWFKYDGSPAKNVAVTAQP